MKENKGNIISVGVLYVSELLCLGVDYCPRTSQQEVVHKEQDQRDKQLQITFIRNKLKEKAESLLIGRHLVPVEHSGVRR